MEGPRRWRANIYVDCWLENNQVKEASTAILQQYQQWHHLQPTAEDARRSTVGVSISEEEKPSPPAYTIT